VVTANLSTWFLALIYGGPLVLGVPYAVRGIIRLRKRTARAAGVVRGYDTQLAWKPAAQVAYPYTEFVDQHDVRHEFQSKWGASWKYWPGGSQVKVSYDPNDPANADLALSEIGALLILMVVIVIFLAVIGALLVKQHAS